MIPGVSPSIDHEDVKLAGRHVVAAGAGSWPEAVAAVAGGELQVDEEWPLCGLQALSSANLSKINTF